jgi:hypothetical protein
MPRRLQQEVPNDLLHAPPQFFLSHFPQLPRSYSPSAHPTFPFTVSHYSFLLGPYSFRYTLENCAPSGPNLCLLSPPVCRITCSSQAHAKNHMQPGLTSGSGLTITRTLKFSAYIHTSHTASLHTHPTYISLLHCLSTVYLDDLDTESTYLLSKQPRWQQQRHHHYTRVATALS